MPKHSLQPLAAAACALLCIGNAWAQEVQRVEITGSHIKRIDVETSSPVVVLSREEIKMTGATTVKQLVDQLASASSTLSDISGSNSFAGGASAVNLRNMGKSSTLLLLNGRRVAPYALADFNEVFSNVDNLPMEAVERIEVLKNGASAIYGSDAVAGVINVITRRDYRGLQVALNHEQSLKNDRFKETSAAITGGFGDFGRDKYNVLANVEVMKRESVMWRDVMEDVNPARLRAGAIPTTLVAQYSTFSWPGNVVGAGAIEGCPADMLISGLCRYDRFQRFQALPSSDRVNALISGRLDLGNQREAFAEVLYSKTQTEYKNAFPIYGNINSAGTVTWGNPLTNTGKTFYYRGLGASHPLNPLGEDDVDFRYRFVDAPAGTKVDADAYRFLAGLRGVQGAFDWETSLGFLGGKAKMVGRGSFSDSAFKELIGDYNLDPLPVDFFNKVGGYKIGGVNSAEVLNRLFPEVVDNGKVTQTVWDGKVSGEWGSMGGGPIGVALGFDLRHEKMSVTPSDNMAQGDVVGRGVSSSNGSRNFWAVFGEVSLPVTKTVEVQAAARIDKFPNLAPHLAPKIGAKWRASDALMVRATMEGGFRAPNLSETAPSTKFAFDNGVIDPKRCTQAQSLADDLRVQAEALPDSDSNKQVLLARADIVAQGECEAGIASITRNNPNLKPEESNSFTLGMIFQPVKDVDISVDYWQIRRKNEIWYKSSDELLAVEDSGLPEGSSISRLPLTANDPTFTLAEQAKYGVTIGPIETIASAFNNLFKTRTSGIDVGANFKTNTDIGRVGVDVKAQYLISYRAFNGTDNRFGDNLAGRYGYPRLQGSLGLSLSRGNWSNSLRLFHTSGTSLNGDYYIPTGTQEWCAARNLPTCRLNTETTVDYSVRYSGIKNLTLGVYIRNLMDSFTPIDWRAQYGTPIPQARSDARGRMLRLSAEYKFW